MKLKSLLKLHIPEEYHPYLFNSYDIIGDIAVIEPHQALLPVAEKLARLILASNRRLRVVAARQGIHDGEFRIMPLHILAGEHRTETEHREYGIRLRMDLEKVYFSPRSAEERLRVARMVKQNERVCVFFSGVAPFPLMIAANSQPECIVGIEKNPIAHHFAQTNIHLNKQGKKITAYCGDVSEVTADLSSTFDRIIMPLPHLADHFLPDALSSLKLPGTLHFYDFQKKDRITASCAKVQQACHLSNRTLADSSTHVCGHCGPDLYRVCVDAHIV